MFGSASPERAIPGSRPAWREGRPGPATDALVTAGSWISARSRLWQLVLPVLLVCLAYASRERLLPDAGDKSPFQTFVVAALVAALAGGFGPGVLAMGLGAAFATYLYLPPFQALAIDTGTDLLRLGLFVVEGLLAALAGEAVHRAARRERTLSRGAARFRSFLHEAAASRSLAADDEVPLLEALSERELEVVRLLALGLRNDEISARLFVSRNTVKTHLAHIYAKLGVRTRTEAVARCIGLGLLEPPAVAAD